MLVPDKVPGGVVWIWTFFGVLGAVASAHRAAPLTFATRAAARALPEDFGVRLDAATIDDVLAAQRARRVAYRERAADDLAALRAQASQ